MSSYDSNDRELWPEEQAVEWPAIWRFVGAICVVGGICIGVAAAIARGLGL